MFPGFIFFLVKRRRNSKNKKFNDDDLSRRNSVTPHPYNEYNNYGSPTMVGTDTNSLSTGRPLSMSTNTVIASGAKPRPFVQAYNPDPSQQQNYNNNGYDINDPSQQQQHYNNTGYDNHDPSQYYDYQNLQQQQQQYGVSNNYTGYPHDGYYAQQAEPMIPNSTSNPTGISKMGRNVPDEIDYPRHVPDEIDAVAPPPNTK